MKAIKKALALSAIAVAMLTSVRVFAQEKIESVSDTAEIRIDVQDTENIEGGKQVFVKAYDQDEKQIGFGKDGTVEIERFRIINPPRYVPDEAGDIEIESYNPVTKTSVIRKYREDASEALNLTVKEAIKVKQEAFINSDITQGKVGKTTTIIYADPDGYVERNSANSSWSSLRSGAGTAKGTGNVYFGFEAGTTSNLWSRIFRGVIKFDTSAIPDTDEISSATISLTGDFKQDPNSNSIDGTIYSTAVGALSNSDYDNSGSVALSDTLAYASFSTTTPNVYTLNATGIASISLSTSTPFVVRNTNKDAGNVAPTWANGNQTIVAYKSSSAVGTTDDPKLTIEHTDSGIIEVEMVFERNATTTCSATDGVTTCVSEIETDPYLFDHQIIYNAIIILSVWFFGLIYYFKRQVTL